MKKNWYAIYTKPCCEKRVATLLTKRKIENYCPLNRILVSGSMNKKKAIYQPLLTSFVFVYITDIDMAIIKRTNCVINFVYWLGKPAIIQNEEILNLQHFTSEYSNVQLEKTSVNPTEAGKITSEPLIDINGKLVSLKNTHIKLSLPSLGYRIVAEVEKSNADIFNKTYQRSKLFS